MDDTNNILLNHVNYDPILWMDCTQKEIMMVGAVIATPLLIIGAVFGYLAWGNIPFGILPGFILSLGGIYLGLKIIGKIKQDKEPGYIDQVIADKLEQNRLLKTGIIRRSGSWSIGRFYK